MIKLSLTVGELKEVLKDLPDDMEVYMDSNDDTYYLDVKPIYYKPKTARVVMLNGRTMISMSASDKKTKNVFLFVG